MKDNIQFGIVGRVLDSLCDGQTVKTRTLVKELEHCYPNCRIRIAETGTLKKMPLRFLAELISLVKKSDIVFVLLSKNGIRLIFPVLFFLNLLYKKPIIHDCIGGTQETILQRYPYLKKYYQKMEVNWVETENLKKKLENEGLHNVEVLPNFKILKTVPVEALPGYQNTPFRFCTFSRVNEAKGIGRAADAVLEINQKAGNPIAELHIYGPLEENYGTTLDTYIQKSNGAIQYCGIANPDNSVDILKDYFILLFPTTFHGEGFPGTLIDALSAGLPVIATDWHCNSEIIDHGKTGFIYDPEQPEQLERWMTYAIENPQQIHTMRSHCLEAVKQYSAETVMKTVCKKIDELIG